jgi:hypothetical protein
MMNTKLQLYHIKFIIVPIKKNKLARISEICYSVKYLEATPETQVHSAVWIPLFTTFPLSMPRIHCLLDSPFLPVRWTASIKCHSNSHCASRCPEGHPALEFWSLAHMYELAFLQAASCRYNYFFHLPTDG